MSKRPVKTKQPARILPFPEPRDLWDIALDDSTATPAERRFVRRMKAMHVSAQAGMEIVEAIILLEKVKPAVLAEAMKLLRSKCSA